MGVIGVQSMQEHVVESAGCSLVGKEIGRFGERRVAIASDKNYCCRQNLYI